ncbi:MAG TPA: penicillin-binding protein 2 [Candidatus Saccharimonadales bacterium]|nr:penicillin-binding protein 2 [Candidatus Saccharimonadales bacterium]
MDRSPSRGKPALSSNRRLYLWYGALLFIIAVIILRLFYLQIVRHDYYQTKALNDQLKQYSIAPSRGLIEAHQAGGVVPLVLNQQLYTLYVDPTLVKNPTATADKLAVVTGGNAQNYTSLVKTKNTRYVILAKQLSQDQNSQILALKLPGVGLQAQDYRTYPQGSLAAQLLGFVNNAGQGTYGIEQALNSQLAGTPGQLKAITDVNGVPLAASRDNIQIDPKPGDNVVLTINLAMQKELENYLKAGIQRAQSDSASALIMDPNSGAILAMANWPTYDPSQYYNVTDPSVFQNAAVSLPLEIGSIMKVLTTSAALDQRVITPTTSYDDPGSWLVDGFTIKNVEEDGGPGQHNIADILNLSMNTGATWMLMQMGGGQLDQRGRETWHNYMVDHYQLGKLTGIEQGYESAGTIPSPDNGPARDLTYANTAFGQSMTATPLQMAAALSSVINGGVYYQPHLVDQAISSSGKVTSNKPKIVDSHVVSPSVSPEIRSLMEYVVRGHLAEGYTYMKFPSNYSVGGKTGTAQVPSPQGGYYADRFNGTYMGYVGGDKPQYVIAVRVSDPHIGGYAGSTAAQPIFADLAHMLINNFNVTPKTGS